MSSLIVFVTPSILETKASNCRCNSDRSTLWFCTSSMNSLLVVYCVSLSIEVIRSVKNLISSFVFDIEPDKLLYCSVRLPIFDDIIDISAALSSTVCTLFLFVFKLEHIESICAETLSLKAFNVATVAFNASIVFFMSS